MRNAVRRVSILTAALAVASTTSVVGAAAASARGPECQPNSVCLYSEPNYGHPHGITVIPVSALYDCKSYTDFGGVGSAFNNTKFRFEIRTIPEGVLAGTMAPYKKYAHIAYWPHSVKIVSPGC